MSDTSMNSQHMSIDNVLAYLSGHKDYCENYTTDNDSVWQKTVDALESAISIISALQDEGISDAEGVKDLISTIPLFVSSTKTFTESTSKQPPRFIRTEYGTAQNAMPELPSIIPTATGAENG